MPLSMWLNGSVRSAVYLNTASDCRKTAVKLHKQFTHPTSEKLIKLLRNANINSEDLEREIKAVSEKCNIYMFSTAETCSTSNCEYVCSI